MSLTAKNVCIVAVHPLVLESSVGGFSLVSSGNRECKTYADVQRAPREMMPFQQLHMVTVSLVQEFNQVVQRVVVVVWRRATLRTLPPPQGFRFNPSTSHMWLAHKGLARWRAECREAQRGGSSSGGEERRGGVTDEPSPENLNLLLLSIKLVTTTLTTQRERRRPNSRQGWLNPGSKSLFDFQRWGLSPRWIFDDMDSL